MQASYASGCALGLPHRILGTQKSMETIQYGFACLMRTLSKATEARSAVVAGQTGGAEEVRQGKGVPFRRALHTFGTPCTLRCTPFSIEVCRRFLLFSLVYEPFPMLSRRPARHAHLFSNDLYTRERDIYFFIYKTYKMVCIVCSTPKSPDKSGFKLHTMAKNGVQDSVHGVQGSVHERRNARIGMPSPCRTPSVRPPASDRRPQGGHPCIERMRDAQGRSNIPQTASEAF